MPPFYPDSYHNGLPGQPYYPDYTYPTANEQPQNQYVHQSPRQPVQPSPRVQVNVPPRQPLAYPQSPIQYQYPPVQQPFNTNPASSGQFYNQQPFVYNNQYQQQYQQPSQVRVIVPPSPNQYNQPPQRTIPLPPGPYSAVPPPPRTLQFQQETPRVKQEGSLFKQETPQFKRETPQSKPRILQEQPNMVKSPMASTQKSVPKVPASAVSAASEKQSRDHAIILTLADEYIENARKLEERTEDYHILMSTALGCLQAALRNYKLSPIRSAQVSLKYAQLLYDETDNLDDAEIVLTKSIDLCERMKFLDLKYAMQLLLAKVLFRSKPRAAIRDLEGMIQDLETYKHTAWEYPFRFQVVCFLLASPNQHNMHDALQHLEKIQVAANLHSDRAVYAFAAILESLLHLRNPGQDSLSHSQQALAKARSHQLNPDVESHPQMSIMMEIIDLMWSLNTAVDPEVLDQKRSNLNDALYASIDGNRWTKDEGTWLRVNSKSLKGIPIQVGGLIHDMDGRYFVTLSWLNRKDFESLCYLLSGALLVPRNHYMRGKAEQFALEGYQITNDGLPAQNSILRVKDGTSTRRSHLMSIYLLAEIAFMRASEGKWDKTRETAKSIDTHMKELGEDVPSELRALSDYLNGCIAQGTGDLDLALKYFQSKHLALRSPTTSSTPSKPQKPVTNHTLLDLQLLATINTVFIIRLPSHHQHTHLDRLLNLLAIHFPNNANRPDASNIPNATGTTTLHPLIAPTHTMLLSTLPNTTILQTKSLLAGALSSARRVNSIQVMGLCLTLMYDRFFRGGIQDVQAVKCAKAASHHVRSKLGNPLWAVMTGILEAESMELVGEEMEDVRRKREAVGKLWESLPDGVKRSVEKG